MRRSQQALCVTTAFVGGLCMGLAAWSTAIRRSRRDLFGGSRVRRLAALGYLNAHPGVETLRVLGEYVMWEQEPVLRRRGERMLRRMQTHLE